MCLKTFFYTKFFGTMVGEDLLGNKYYESKHKRWFGKNNRWVVYSTNNKSIANIDTVWYKWMHYMTEKPPMKIKKNHDWIFESGVTEYDKIDSKEPKESCNENYSIWNNKSIK